MKIAVLNDTHCGVRNSSEIFINYQKRFYDEIFFPYLDKHNIKNIIHLGDYYDHRKYINFKALHSNRKHFLEPMKERGITMDIIPGNHDTFYKNTNELCSLKELLGYFTNNVNIIMCPKIMNYDGFEIGLIPWINDENNKKTMNFLNNCDRIWIAGHFEIIGFDMMKGMPNEHGYEASIFDKFEKVLSGHFHTKSSKGNIHYLGSQMEFTWADVNDQKYFHIIDTQKKRLTPIKNPITIFKKVLYNDTNFDYNRDYDVSLLNEKFVKLIIEKKSDHYLFEQFVKKIQSEGKVYDLKILESFNEFEGSNVEIDKDNIKVEDTPKLLDSYIENAETDLSKERLKNLAKSVYIEALNMGEI